MAMKLKLHPLLVSYLIASLSIFLAIMFGVKIVDYIGIQAKFSTFAIALIAAVIDMVLSMVFMGVKNFNWLDLVYSVVVYYTTMLYSTQITNLINKYTVMSYNVEVYVNAALTSLVAGVLFSALNCLGSQLVSML